MTGPLHLASRLGKKDIVNLLIQAGARVGSKNSDGGTSSTPVYAAAVAGHTDVVQLLINNGANLTNFNDGGNTILEATMSRGHRDTVQALLRTLGRHEYPLSGLAFELALANSVEDIDSLMAEAGIRCAVMNLIQQDSDRFDRILRVFDKDCMLVKPRAIRNMLHVAISSADMGLIDYLVILNPDLGNEHFITGDTPLTLAVRMGNAAIVQKLLHRRHNSTVPARDLVNGRLYTPLELFLEMLDIDTNKDTSILNLLLEDNRYNIMRGPSAHSNPFAFVLSHDSLWGYKVAGSIASKMLQHSDLDARADDGSSIMHVAVHHRRHSLVASLVAQGVDVNTRDNRGCTPFILECTRSSSFLRFLLTKGADFNARDRDGQSALHAAAGAGQVAVITLLLSLGLDVDVFDNDNYTPLTWALISGQEEAAMRLLSHGAIFQIEKLRRGRTVLHIAASLVMTNVVRKILETTDLEINAQDELGWTPLALACRRGVIELVEMLLDNGARIDIGTGEGELPVQIAERCGNDDVVTLLISRGVKEDHGYGQTSSSV